MDFTARIVFMFMIHLNLSSTHKKLTHRGLFRAPCHENQCLKAVCFKSSKPMVFCVFFHVYHHNIKSLLCTTDMGLFEYRVAPNLTISHHFPWENNYLGAQSHIFRHTQQVHQTWFHIAISADK